MQMNMQRYTKALSKVEESWSGKFKGTFLYTPAECFHWRGSFHSLSTGGGASSLPMSRTVPGSSNHFGWALLGLIKVIVFGTFIKVITWQKITAQLTWEMLSPFLNPLHRPSRYPLSMLNITPFMLRLLEKYEIVKGPQKDCAHFPQVDSCCVWWSVFTWLARPLIGQHKISGFSLVSRIRRVLLLLVKNT